VILSLHLAESPDSSCSSSRPHLGALNDYANGRDAATCVFLKWSISIYKETECPCLATLVADVLYLRSDRARYEKMCALCCCLCLLDFLIGSERICYYVKFCSRFINVVDIYIADKSRRSSVIVQAPSPASPCMHGAYLPHLHTSIDDLAMDDRCSS
jgi:hypothetical protein